MKFAIGEASLVLELVLDHLTNTRGGALFVATSEVMARRLREDFEEICVFARESSDRVHWVALNGVTTISSAFDFDYVGIDERVEARYPEAVARLRASLTVGLPAVMP